jgi:AcrR family transcriptional regulator
MDTVTPQHGSATGQRRRNRRGEGERLRDDLLDAAQALLEETGDARRLSLRSVASRVGIAATSVYLHFPDIADLKVAVASRGFAALEEARDAASYDITDPAEALLARVRVYAHFALHHPGLYRLMFGPDLPSNLAYDAERSPARAALQSLAQSIERCRAAEMCDPSDDSIRSALLVWTAVHGSVILRIDRPHFPWPPLDQLVDETVRRLVGMAPQASC